jgi:hypothetical protein
MTIDVYWFGANWNHAFGALASRGRGEAQLPWGDSGLAVEGGRGCKDFSEVFGKP